MRKIYLNDLPRHVPPVDLVNGINCNLQAALLKHSYECVLFETTIIRSRVDPTASENAGHGFIRIALCDQEAKVLADEISLNLVDNKHKIVARVPKAEIPQPKVKATRREHVQYSEKKLGRIRNRERKFHKLREFIVRLSTGKDSLHCDQYKSIFFEKSSTSLRADRNDIGTVNWDTVPSCVDPGHNFVRNEPLGNNDHVERLIREATLQNTAMLDGIEGDAVCPHGHDALSTATRGSKVETMEGVEVPGRSSAVCGPHRMTTRSIRKRCQIESFVEVLSRILPVPVHDVGVVDGMPVDGRRSRLHIVDFGSGAGNLCLPLAFLFPQYDFSAVDMKEQSISILQQRAEAAGLLNIKGYVQRIEEFDQPFDIALALHACGKATDYALWQAERWRAAYIVCPCCVGNLTFTPATDPEGANTPFHPKTGGPKSDFANEFVRCDEVAMDVKERTLDTSDDNSSCDLFALLCGKDQPLCSVAVTPTQSVGSGMPLLTHPRSAWLMRELGTDGQVARSLFNAMVKSGDISHGSAHPHVSFDVENEGIARMCKCYLEVDRNMHMKETGYHVALLRLIRSELTGKAELLVGVPQESVKMGVMRWNEWEVEV